MNWSRLIQGISLSFVFIASLGIFASGLQWFFPGHKSFEGAFTASVSDGAEEIVLNGAAEEIILNKKQNISGLDIDAQSAISIQTNLKQREVLFNKNGDRKLLIASISKLITALIILENIELSEKIEISKGAQDLGGDIEPLKEAEVFFAKDLLYAMIIGSNNAAAQSFSESIGKDRFIKLMNEKAEELGLLDTSFLNPTGLGLDNFSTAEDLAKLAEYLLKERPSVFSITTMPEFDLYTADGKTIHEIINTNDLLREPSDFRKRIVGGKTGFTRQAGQGLLLAIESKDGQSFLISVVLGSKNRIEETKKIINWLNW